MPVEQLLPLMGFIIVMMVTPGPNNLMLLASGANFGFRRSLPHILGITFGCQVLLVAVAFGLGGVFVIWPQSLLVLRVLCVFILIYLAWLLVRPVRSSTVDPEKQPRPLTFLEAALFQWVNPKAWMMIIAVVTTYTQPGNMAYSLLIIASLFVVLGIPMISTWNLFGVSLQNWLSQPSRAKAFNWVMAVLLLASLIPVLFS